MANALSIPGGGHKAAAAPLQPAWLPAQQAFAKVVEAGSMAAAARALGCTRAQGDKQLSGLETALGAHLLERSTRRLALTPAGQVFHQHALTALESGSAAQLAVHNLGDEAHGVLRERRHHLRAPARRRCCPRLTQQHGHELIPGQATGGPGGRPDRPGLRLTRTARRRGAPPGHAGPRDLRGARLSGRARHRGARRPARPTRRSASCSPTTTTGTSPAPTGRTT